MNPIKTLQHIYDGSNIPKLFTDERAQAYTLEAIIATVMIVGIILFVAPSFATPSYDSQTEEIETHAEMQKDLENILEARLQDGTLKHSILNYDDSEGEFADTTAFTNPSTGFYLEAPSDEFGEDLSDFEHNHNVTMNVVLIPESTQSEGDNPKRAFFIKRISPGNPIFSVSIRVPLNDKDRLQSPPEAHTHLSSATNRSAGDGVQLEDTNNYPIEEANNRGAGDESIYNVVIVRVIVHKPTNFESS